MRSLVRLVSLAALAALSLAACGDNHGTPDAAADDAPDAPPGGERAVLVAGDFAATGVLSTLELPGRAMHANAVAGVAGKDPVVRHVGRELFVVNRGEDNVTILDDQTLALIDQISTGTGSNPQDVAVIGDRLYVAALAAAGLVVIDRAAADAVSTIDLAALDPDGHPDCVSVYAVGARLYVACGLLDNFVPRGPGVVAVVDAGTGAVATTLTLPAANPFSLFARTPEASVFGGDLVIGTAPSFQDFSTGCLARIAVGAAPAANGCVAQNADLGGYANHVEASADGSVLWVAADGFTATFESFGALRGVDLASGVLWAGAVSPPDQVIVDLAACPSGLVVATDAGAVKGARVYDGATELTSAPLPLGLPPSFGGNVACYAW